MQRVVTVLEILVPIFAAIALGMLARRKGALTREGVMGMQQYVMQYGLPCVLFNSCLSASIGAESLTSMALVLPMMLLSVTWAFRMGVLDMAQALVCITTIALLTAKTDEGTRPAEILRQVFTSPLLLMSLLGLALNLSGAKAWLEAAGIASILTETAGFIAQPVSAAILFAVGYNFSLGSGNRSHIFKISAIHFAYFTLFGLLIQLVLFLLPGVEAQTRWAILIYTTLPPSFLSLGLGRNEEEYEMAAGVCSLLTVVSLAIFCVIAVIVS